MASSWPPLHDSITMHEDSWFMIKAFQIKSCTPSVADICLSQAAGYGSIGKEVTKKEITAGRTYNQKDINQL